MASYSILRKDKIWADYLHASIKTRVDIWSIPILINIVVVLFRVLNLRGCHVDLQHRPCASLVGYFASFSASAFQNVVECSSYRLFTGGFSRYPSR